MRDSEKLTEQRRIMTDASARLEAASNAEDHVVEEHLYYHAAIDCLKVMISMDPTEE